MEVTGHSKYAVSSSIFIYTRNRIILHGLPIGIVFKPRLKYSKELFDYTVKNTKTYIINN